MIYAAELIHALETFPPTSMVCAAMRGEVAALAVHDAQGNIIAFIDAADNARVEPMHIIYNPV